MSSVPHTMRAVRLQPGPTGLTLAVRPVPVPTPGPGQALVRVAAAALHDVDRRSCRVADDLGRPLPTTPGREGVGTVVAVGGGLLTRWLVGRRVAFLTTDTEDGAWAEYVVTDVPRCLPLDEDVTDVHAAALLRTGVLTLGALDRSHAAADRGIVVTAPTSRLMIALAEVARAEGVPVVAVARDGSEAERLRARGETRVVDLTAADADAQLRRWSRTVGARAVVDVVGGTTLGRVLAALPEGAEALGLDPEAAPVVVDAVELVRRGKTLAGASVSALVAAQGRRGVGPWARRIQRHLARFCRPVAGRIGLDEVPARVAEAGAPDGAPWIVVPGASVPR